MIAILQSGALHCVLALMFSALTATSADGQTIDFTWTSAGTFNGSPSSGTVVTTFLSSAPLDLLEFHATYTGQGGATRVFGPFEITSGNGDQLFGNFEIVGSGPIHEGMNFGAGEFTFSGGTGQFDGATGEGTLDVKTTLATFPTTTGDVEQQWRGTLTLVPLSLPGDFNGDGTVDAADYVVWRKIDGTQEGYDVWRANFGAAVGSGAASINRTDGPAAVPEPTTALLAMMALRAAFYRCRPRP